MTVVANGAIRHVQPAYWWVGMQHKTLQILLHGDNIGAMTPSIGQKGVKLVRTVRPTNANYLILYVDLTEAQAGTFDILLTRGRKQLKVPYALHTRRPGSALRKGFSAEDVIYLAMPDRFANADPRNDVVKGLHDQQVDRHEPFARHGGDLKGLTRHLDYLADLGITALWLTPTLVNDMPQGAYHGYAATDLYLTDPRLGTNEDYFALVRAAHDRGIKVIKDLVFNHCGLENFLYRDMPDSTWFSHDGHFFQTTHNNVSLTDPHAMISDQQGSVDGWFVSSMPDFNGAHPDVAQYLIQHSIWWVEAADLDGIRQDTYPYNDFNLMAQWCQRMAEEYPHFNIVGEAWLNNNVAISMWQKDSKLATRNSHLPTLMDFPLMGLCDQAFKDNGTDNRPIGQLYEYLTQDHVYANPHNLLIFLDNHDTSRFNRTATQAADTARYRQALAFLLTTRGIPQLYYGDEIGMYADKSQGDGMLRQDFPGGWPTDTLNAFTAVGRAALPYSSHDYARRLLQWRKGNEAVAKGRLMHYAPQNGVYIYARQYKDRLVTVFINSSNQPAQCQRSAYAPLLPRETAYDVIGGATRAIGDSLTIAPRSALILDFQ